MVYSLFHIDSVCHYTGCKHSENKYSECVRSLELKPLQRDVILQYFCLSEEVFRITQVCVMKCAVLCVKCQ